MIDWKQRHAVENTPERTQQIAKILSVRKLWQEHPELIEHGTYAGNSIGGCKCPDCSNAAIDYRIDRLDKVKEELQANPNDPRHGTTGATLDCGCEKCNIDRVLYMQNYRLRLMQELGSDPEHPAHGTSRGDLANCPCDRCRDYYNTRRKRYQQDLRAELKADPEHIMHGSPTAARVGCRCAECKTVFQELQKDYRQKNTEILEADPNHPWHGTDMGSGQSRCKCDKCSEYRNAQGKYYRQKLLAELKADPDHPRHGTSSAASAGCSCPKCSTEKKRRIQERKLRKGSIVNWTERYAKEDEDPCWCGYHMVGMKDKDGKKVPNCVPNKKSNIDWTKRYAHEGVPVDDLEALAGHLIGDHKYPAEGMKNLFRDFSGEFGDPRTPLSEVRTELKTFHHYEHKD